MLNSIVQNIKKLLKEKKIISNIIQAEFWQKNFIQSGWVNQMENLMIIFPFFIFHDDLQVGNALGSHASVQSFSTIYAFIGCLPPELASKINSIFFCGLVHTEDFNHCKKEDIS